MPSHNEPIRNGRSAPPPKPRWFRVGPGLLLAIIGSVLLWRQLPPGPGGSTGPPRMERTRVDVTPVAPLSAPDPNWLLSQKEVLGLSAGQVQKLTKLEARWSRDTHELRDEIARASEEFNRDMASGGAKGVTIEALREKAAPVSALSRELTEARRAWWGDARKVLTPAQQKKAETRWQARLSHRPPHQ